MTYSVKVVWCVVGMLATLGILLGIVTNDPCLAGVGTGGAFGVTLRFFEPWGAR